MRQVGRRDVGDHLSQLSLESFWTHSFAVSVTPFIKKKEKTNNATNQVQIQETQERKLYPTEFLKDKLQKGRITHCSKKLWIKAICCE